MPGDSGKYLPCDPQVCAAQRQRIAADYLHFSERGLPENLSEYLLQKYEIDTATEYAGLPIANPWGKASGQLSMNARQVAEDVEAGLGFVVLKTVIGQDATGTQTMQAWAVRKARMVAEQITGRSGEQGWTISWKGRGWWQSFDEYLQLIRDAQRTASGTPTLIVPSCKYHLPLPGEEAWKTSEYEYTTRRIWEAWNADRHDDRPVMPLEKDFSPTLAGSDRAGAQTKILEWLRTVPQLIRQAVPSQESKATAACSPIRVGLKLFNALFDDDFQLEMLRVIHEPGPSRPDYYVYGNRLFDPNRQFEGHAGIAYGGPDLSDRNLKVLARFQREVAQTEIGSPPLSWSGTGNITTGKMALEYALRGAGSFQLHTFFQLPGDQYRMKLGNKPQKSLHELYFHPETGFLVWMLHLAQALGLPTTPLRFADVVGKGR